MSPKILNQKYLTDEQTVVGEGSFGVVYRGQRLCDLKCVAIKQTHLDRNRTHVLKLLRNMRCTTVVQIMDVCYQNDQTYVVMELCHGNLQEHLSTTSQALSTSNWTQLQQSISAGYLHLHKLQIAHRDIKPENILLKYQNNDWKCVILEAKLSDFGCSSVNETSMSGLCGTALYMAPEVGANTISETSFNYKVDMWSIGVMFYQCVTTKLPFDESELCRLFLQSNTKNFAAYKHPTLLLSQFVGREDRQMINGLLEMDVCQRLSPQQLIALITRKINNQKVTKRITDNQRV